MAKSKESKRKTPNKEDIMLPIKMENKKSDLTEQHLESSKNRPVRSRGEWEKTFNAVSDSILIISKDFKIIQANFAAVSLLERPLDEIVGKTFWEVIHKSPKSLSQCPLKKACRSKQHEEVELYVPEKHIWLHISVSPILDEAGNLEGIVHIIKDVTHWKRAEQEILKEREKANKYLEVAAVMMIVISAEQRVELINKKGCKILGYKEKEVLGENWFDSFVPERFHEEIKNLFEKVISGRMDCPEYHEYPVLTRKGDERLIAWHCTVLKDDKCRIIATINSGEDITERRRMEDALHRSEEKYRKLFENAVVGVGISSVSGKVLAMNKAMKNITGFSLKDFSDVDLGDTYAAPEDRKKFLKIMNRDGVVENFEVRLINQKGQIYWASLSSRPTIYDGEDAFLTTVLNITERRQAEEELRKFKTISDKAGYGITIIDLEGKNVYANESFAKMHGYTTEEVIGKHISIYHTKQQMAAVNRLIERLNREGSFIAEDLWHKRKDGTEFPALMNGTLIKDENGTPLFMAGTAVDITERKRAEDALRESEARFRAVAALSPAAIAILKSDEHGEQFLYVNAAWEVLTGYAQADAMCLKPIELTHPDMRTLVSQRARARIRDENVPSRYENKIVTKDGKTKWLDFASTVIQYKDEPAILTVALDISERKITEQQLLEERVMLKSLASELTLAEEKERQRIATYIHDYIAQNLAMSKFWLQQVQQFRSEKILKNKLSDVLKMLDEVIASTRNVTFNLSPPALYELGLETALVELLNTEVERKHGIKTEFEDDGLPKPLDEEIRILLFRDIRELLFNVVKHAHATKVKVSIRCVDERVRVCVEDDGVGFNMEVVRQNASKIRGFGLFSIRQRLEQLGGKFEIAHESGRGGIVTMEVPLKSTIKTS